MVNLINPKQKYKISHTDLNPESPRGGVIHQTYIWIGSERHSETNISTLGGRC